MKMCSKAIGKLNIDSPRLPKELQEDLECYAQGHLLMTADVESLIKQITISGKLADLALIDKIQGFVASSLPTASLDETLTLGTINIDCSLFYEYMGRMAKAVSTCENVLAHAERVQHSMLKRRAHNVLAILYSRSCNFDLSCRHMDVAYRLSLDSQSKLFISASLSNTVAILFGAGFYKEALRLSLKVATLPGGQVEIDCLQLQNANNGVKLSNFFGDSDTAEHFLRISVDKMSLVGAIVGNVAVANHMVVRAQCMIIKGEAQSALAMINETSDAIAHGVSTCVKAIIECAKADVNLALKDQVGIRSSELILNKMLKEEIEVPHYREEILKTLIRIASAGNQPADESRSLEYASKLRDHVVLVKHGLLFSKNRTAFCDSNQTAVLENPSYELPEWIVKILRTDALPESVTEYKSTDEELADVSVGMLINEQKPKLEKRLRSKQYNAAENWAITSEAYSKDGGNHARWVSILAYAVAKELGFSDTRSLALALAARLHDIGMIAAQPFGASRHRSPSTTAFSLIREHSSAGNRVLSSSKDKVLRLAAHIARDHHEWWNGTGLPSGLQGEQISIETRICTIADIFAEMMDSNHRQAGWNADAAMRQMEAMAGYQIDPALIKPLKRVVSTESLRLMQEGRSS